MIRLLLLFAGLCLLVACGEQQEAVQPATHSPSSPADAPPASRDAPADSATAADPAPRSVREAVLLASTVKIKHGNGEAAWKLKPKDDGAKLVDGDEQELARYKVSPSGKIKISRSDDAALGAVEGRPGKWRLVDPADAKLFVLQRQDDGDWKVERGTEEVLLATLKRRDYGWKVVTAAEELLGKAKRKGEKTSLRDPAEETIYYTKDPLASVALAVLLVEDIPLPLRMGLALKLDHEARR